MNGNLQMLYKASKLLWNRRLGKDKTRQANGYLSRRYVLVRKTQRGTSSLARAAQPGNPGDDQGKRKNNGGATDRSVAPAGRIPASAMYIQFSFIASQAW